MYIYTFISDTRYIHRTSPAMQNGGKACTGPSYENRASDACDCPSKIKFEVGPGMEKTGSKSGGDGNAGDSNKACKWSAWSDWSKCNCGTNLQRKHRTKSFEQVCAGRMDCTCSLG